MLLLSLKILKTFIRRAYVLNASGCIYQTVAVRARGIGNTRKMLQTFEDCVFQQKIDKRFISWMNYDDKKLSIDDISSKTTTTTKCFKTNSLNAQNNDGGLNTKEHMEQQNQNHNHCKKYEVSKQKNERDKK